MGIQKLTEWVRLGGAQPSVGKGSQISRPIEAMGTRAFAATGGGGGAVFALRLGEGGVRGSPDILKRHSIGP